MYSLRLGRTARERTNEIERTDPTIRGERGSAEQQPRFTVRALDMDEVAHAASQFKSLTRLSGLSRDGHHFSEANRGQLLKSTLPPMGVAWGCTVASCFRCSKQYSPNQRKFLECRRREGPGPISGRKRNGLLLAVHIGSEEPSVMSCRQCHGKRVHQSRRTGVIERRILSLILVRPFRCEECDFRFYRWSFSAHTKSARAASLEF
jgi:hypothetical protein